MGTQNSANADSIQTAAVAANLNLGYQLFLDAEKLKDTDNHLEALKLYEEAGKAGYAEGWYTLAKLNQRGCMHMREVHDVLRCFNNASKLGHAASMYEMALAYQQGWGMQQSDTEMFNWALKAAIAGYPEAQYQVGMLYAEGTGTTYNIHEAIIWLTRAAQNKRLNAAEKLYKLVRTKWRHI